MFNFVKMYLFILRHLRTIPAKSRRCTPYPSPRLTAAAPSKQMSPAPFSKHLLTSVCRRLSRRRGPRFNFFFRV